MKQGIFRGFNPASQLFLFFFVSFTSFMLLLAAGSAIIRVLWGIDIIEDQGVLDQHHLPYVVEANRLMMICQHLGMFILPSLLYNQLIGEDRISFLSLKKQIPWTIVAASALIIFSCQPLINALAEFNASFSLPPAYAEVENLIKKMEEAAQTKFEAILTVSSVFGLLANILVIAIIPALGEELMFRGIVQKLFTRIFKNYHIGIWTAAILFSTLHFQFYGFIPRTLLGALFGYLAIWSGSLLMPILAHFLNNFTAVVIDYLVRKEVVSEAINEIGGNSDYVSWAIGGLITLGLVWYLKNQSQWKQNQEEYLEGVLLPEPTDSIDKNQPR